MTLEEEKSHSEEIFTPSLPNITTEEKDSNHEKVYFESNSNESSSHSDSKILPAKFIDHIAIIEDVLTKEQCNHIIELFEQSPHKRIGATLDGIYKGTKNSIDLGVNVPPTPEWLKIDRLLCKITGDVVKTVCNKYNTLAPLIHFDSGYQMQKSFKNQGYFNWHADHGVHCLERALALIWYLNDVEEGGTTEFKFSNVVIKPKAGLVVAFPPYWMYEHRGTIPVSNDKYIITTFVCTNSKKDSM